MENPLIYKLYSKPTHYSNTDPFSNYPNIGDAKAPSLEAKNTLFTNHSLQVQNQSYTYRNVSNNDFYFPFLVGNLIVLIIALSIYRSQFFHSILALFSAKYYQKIELKSLIKHPIVFIFFFLFIIDFSLVIDNIIQFDRLNLGVPYKPHLFYIIAFSIFLFFTVKIILVFISSFIFKVTTYAKVYVDYLFIWTMNIAVFLSIFLWLLIYNENWVIPFIFVGIWILFEALRIFQTLFRIVPKSNFNSFHFFMYLCAVEILPLIVLGKMVMMELK